MFVIKVNILFTGGVFRLYMKFDENYNTQPPEVCFHTIPFHPNGKFALHPLYKIESSLKVTIVL